VLSLLNVRFKSSKRRLTGLKVGVLLINIFQNNFAIYVALLSSIVYFSFQNLFFKLVFRS